ncbi:hypothetical protein AVEN_3724-1, partial [Araneus ventricosus]
MLGGTKIRTCGDADTVADTSPPDYCGFYQTELRPTSTELSLKGVRSQT